MGTLVALMVCGSHQSKAHWSADLSIASFPLHVVRLHSGLLVKRAFFAMLMLIMLWISVWMSQRPVMEVCRWITGLYLWVHDWPADACMCHSQ